MRTSISTTSGRFAGRDVDGIATVAGGADDGDVLPGVEERGEPGTHHLLVIGDEDTDRGRGLGHGDVRSGSSATTSNPLSAWSPWASEPPTVSTRSRIPIRPKPVPGPSPTPGPRS